MFNFWLQSIFISNWIERKRRLSQNTISFVIAFLLGAVLPKKSPNVYKSCPKMISVEKWKILTPLQKLPKNVGDLGKIIVAKGFEKLPNFP